MINNNKYYRGISFSSVFESDSCPSLWQQYFEVLHEVGHCVDTNKIHSVSIKEQVLWTAELLEREPVHDFCKRYLCLSLVA